MAPAAAHILRRIRIRQRIKLVAALAMLLIGTPLTLLGPAVLGTIFWLAAGNSGTWHPWSWFFAAFCLLMVPAMFVGESRLRGGALAEANPDRLPGELDRESLSPLPLMASAHFGLLVGLAANPRLAASGLLETFLLGPRLVLDGLRDLRHWWQLRHTSLPRAADLIGQLFIESSAVPLESLLRPGESMEWLIRVIGLLLFGDWIGISKTGYRVWLLTDGAKEVAAVKESTTDGIEGTENSNLRRRRSRRVADQIRDHRNHLPLHRVWLRFFKSPPDRVKASQSVASRGGCSAFCN